MMTWVKQVIIFIIVEVIQLVETNVILLKSFSNGLFISMIILKNSRTVVKIFLPFYVMSG
jgi:hypothetical protein